MTLQILLQFQLHRCHDPVVVTVDSCSQKCSALGSVDAGLETPWYEIIVDLVVCHWRASEEREGHLVPVC